ncbi:hypothetical protein M2132_001740 [Dysgonomonas sp. PH5-45]|uniref:outer membrane beta-barrel protein n=1 Tax=unclassified Dysgonomonas TaxID=2630389 RepID=UPI002475D66D|nr:MULTISPECIES: outer membrane beta-barrel protein [unclassified Dysgonomonas]MDH6355398.1 hypothetical protein [Dysgonomonas sp. PH5-45]MDH6388295.1 hypothetical protein [Dysgonomonas sp. PH5-37]
MKKLFILSFFCLSAMLISAKEHLTDTVYLSNNEVTSHTETIDTQNSSVSIDGADYNVNFFWQRRPKKWLSPRSGSGFGFSFLNYDDSDISGGKLKQSQSYMFSVGICNYGMQIANSNWMFVSGISLDWARYHFSDNVALTKVDGITQFKPAPEGIDYKSSKLLAHYVSIPVLMEYQYKKFFVSGGVVGFFKYYSKSQVKYYDDLGKHKKNQGRDLNMRTVDLKLRLQAGIGDVSVFAYYSPFSMFKNDENPDIKTYSVGVMIDF